MVALLHVAGVVQDEHSTRIAELVNYVLAQVITNFVGVPHRLTQQPLHPVRRRVSSLLGQLPARPAVHIGQQAEQESPSLAAWLDAPEPRSDPGERRVEMSLPLVYVYAGPGGPRTVLFVHNDHDRAVAVRMPSQHPM